MRKFPFLLCVLALGSAGIAAEAGRNPRFTGTPFFRNWQSEAYGAAPVNWQVTQNPRSGFVYVANNYGLLEFDGTAWRLIEMPNGGPVRSFTLDAAGNGWAGGLGEIAFFPASAPGLAAPVARTAQLPETHRTFGNVTRAYASPVGVYFASGRQVFRLVGENSAQAWTLPANVTGLWWQNEAAHAALTNGEIVRFDGDRFATVAPASASQNFSVHARRTAPDGSTVLLTNLGTRRWRGAGLAADAAGPTEDADFAGDEAVAAAFLPDGCRVYGFLRSGIKLFNPEGRLLAAIDEAHGLPSNRIEDLFHDEEGGIWVAQRSGLVRLQLDSRFALHGPAQRLAGGPRVLVRHFDRLYVAHNEGVDWRDETSGRFQAVLGLRASISTFVRTDGRLFGVGATLQEILPDHRSQPVLRGSQLAIFPITAQPGFFLAGNTTGVSLLRYDDSAWSNLGRLTATDEGVTRFRDGGDGHVWGVAYNGSSVWRFDFRAPASLSPPAHRFTLADGLPPAARRDSPRLAQLGDDLFVTSASGTRRFDAKAGRFVRELGIENFTADLGAVALSGGEGTPWWLTAPPAEQLGRLVPGQSQPWRFEAIPSAQLRGIVPNSLFHDAAHRTLWIAGQGLLVSADLDWQPTSPRPPLRAFVRRLLAADHHTPLDPAAPLHPEQNSLRLVFSTPTYEADFNGHPRTLYRTRLEGFESAWTEWSDATFRDFTNLPYRRLTFHVQARSLDGRESAPATLAFAIAPPWWLRDSSLGLFALAAVGLLVALFRWRTHALRRRNTQLEAVVAARTAELARLRQIDRDESAAAKLAEERARLEVLRYQLNPHFLFNALASVRSQLPPALDRARATIERLTEFCRLTLFRPESGAHPSLEEEMRLLRAYLDIEQTRWGDLLTVEIDADPAAAKAPLPPLLLLPLVENALKYGRSSQAGALTVRLSARLDAAGALRLELGNTGAWIESPDPTSVPSLGIGLENLRQRLRRYYPDAHEFTTESRDGWVIVRLGLLRPALVV